MKSGMVRRKEEALSLKKKKDSKKMLRSWNLKKKHFFDAQKTNSSHLCKQLNTLKIRWQKKNNVYVERAQQKSVMEATQMKAALVLMKQSLLG